MALVGGATGRVGDPSGRSAERPVLSEDAIERNVAGIRGILTSILDRGTAGEGPRVKVRRADACLCSCRAIVYPLGDGIGLTGGPSKPA